MQKIETWPGKPYPLGARYDGMGVNFSLFAENAQAVELCLFDADGNEIGNESEDLSFSETDSAPFVPKCVVIDDLFDWEGDTRLKIPLNKTVVYELHVKGFTKRFPAIPEEMRGTYAGLAHPETIRYLKNLAINAVELMPVHQFINDRHLVENGLTNYWGYNSINFFFPPPRILRIRLAEDDRRYYMDYTGTGNTLNTVHPTILRLIMDSLRYWVTEMHVDGFRFDLASALAREFSDVDKWGSFFDVLHQDPILSQVKLIAEPWDIGENGYQVGNFPAGWMEWNGRYRDSIREFWRGEDEMLPEFANRITGSSDLYFDDWRRPVASINFITAHDGFTLRDLVSYNEKHNEANKENNMDGEDHNRSWNCGAEGETDDPGIIDLRKKQARNFLPDGNPWEKAIDSHEGFVSEEGLKKYEAGEDVYVEGRSVVLLRNRQ